MNSHKDEKGKHLAENKFKTEERKTRFAGGKGENFTKQADRQQKQTAR